MIQGRTSEARVETARAARYLKQLCSHFAREGDTRRVPVRVRVRYDESSGDEASGTAEFGGIGTCSMRADPDGLLLRATAGDPVRLRLVQRVVAGHLERFGRRDGLTVRWRRAPSR